MQQLIIFRPIRSARITQRFGESGACVYPNGKVVNKRNGVCPQGSRSFYESVGLKGHNGFDLAALHGEMVYHGATFDGVMKVEKDAQGGIGVDVISKRPLFFHGQVPKGLTPYKLRAHGFEAFVKMRYWHLKSAIGFDGKEVVFGQPIGLADSTGASSGDHLHFSVKWCDANGKSLASDNGYTGAFDQAPFYNHSVFAGEQPKYLKLDVPKLTDQEQKEIKSQLSKLQRALLGFRELMYKL